MLLSGQRPVLPRTTESIRTFAAPHALPSIYGLEGSVFGVLDEDAIEEIRADYRKTGIQRSNRAYGYVRRRA